MSHSEIAIFLKLVLNFKIVYLNEHFILSCARFFEQDGIGAMMNSSDLESRSEFDPN